VDDDLPGEAVSESLGRRLEHTIGWQPRGSRATCCEARGSGPAGAPGRSAVRV